MWWNGDLRADISQMMSNPASAATPYFDAIEFGGYNHDNFDGNAWHLWIDNLYVGTTEKNGTLVPIAAFSTDPFPAVGAAPLTVLFTNTSSGSPTSWQWDFDGDGVIDSNDQHPRFTYAQDGEYTATLTAANASGAATVTMNVSVSGESVEASGAQPGTSGSGGNSGSGSSGCFIRSCATGR